MGEGLHRFAAELFPICRSITGEGLRETLRRISERVPLTVHEVRSGTKVFDWTIPREWNIRDAYVKDTDGKRVIDFQASNLHVVNYSVPVDETMSLEELQPHLHSIPERPEWIPYRTSYYREDWGFCLNHQTRLGLADGTYEVRIDSRLEPGSLTYGELLVPGRSPEEVLISAHVCHPSLANDNLSGLVVATLLAQTMAEAPRKLSYRFLFIPGTIGSIAWLHANRENIGNVKHGLVLTCLGDPGHVTYKRSRQGNAIVDRAVEHVLAHSAADSEVIDFSPDGYDERQFCSPAFDLPVGCFMRTPHHRFPEYHTSADDLDFITPEHLGDSFEKIYAVLTLLDENETYLSTNPECEPQLGRRGLFRTAGGRKDESLDEFALLWVLNLADGRHSLLDMAERSGIPFRAVHSAAEALRDHELLRPVE
jgi:aminopeptidase-like protein